MKQLDHETFMRRCVELARRSVPSRPFAAVIVDQRSNEILAEGWNRSEINPVWHGEIDAINNLAKQQTDTDFSELVLYTTAEPCPMCQSAILWSGIGTVVFGTSIKHLQQLGWKQIDICADEVIRRSPDFACNLIPGVLEDQCNALFRPA